MREIEDEQQTGMDEQRDGEQRERRADGEPREARSLPGRGDAAASAARGVREI